MARPADRLGQFLSIYALSNFPPRGTFSASMAAALSLSQCCCAEMRPSGVRVINVFPVPSTTSGAGPAPPKLTRTRWPKRGRRPDDGSRMCTGDVPRVAAAVAGQPKILERDECLNTAATRPRSAHRRSSRRQPPTPRENHGQRTQPSSPVHAGAPWPRIALLNRLIPSR